MAAKKKSIVETGVEEDVTEVVNKKKVLVTSVETTLKEVVDYIQEVGEGDLVIKWDHQNLPDFKPGELKKLSYGVVQEYLKAKKQRDALYASQDVGIRGMEILGGSALNRLKLRPRPGYHQTWKRPDEVEEAKAYGYVLIREQKKGEDQKAGYEAGEIKKIRGAVGDELVAMEIRQDVYDRHLDAVSKRSRQAYTNNKKNFATSVEEFNRRTTRSSSRAVVVDDEHDVDG